MQPELDPNTSYPGGRRSGYHSLASALFFGPNGLRAGWSLLIFLLLIGILILPTVPLFQHHLARQATETRLHPGLPDRALADTVTEDGVLFLVLLLSSSILSRIEQRPFAAYGIGPTPGAARQFVAGLFWGALLLSLLVFLLRATHLLVFDGRLLSGGPMLRYAAGWGLGFLGVALFEEYLLRGFVLFTLARGLSGLYSLLVQEPLSRALGFWTAGALLACLFGLGHRSNPGESPLGLVSAAAVALVFSFSLWRTGSLWWAIGFHAAWDWAQSFLYGVPDSGVMMSHHLLASHPLGKPLLSGGLTGPEGSILIVPILALMVLVISLTLPKARRPAPAPTSADPLT